MDGGEGVWERWEPPGESVWLPIRTVKTIWKRRETLPRHRTQQLLANQEEVHQSAGGEQVVGILSQSPVAHLGKTKFQLHHPKHMLDLGPHPRLRPVLPSFHFINAVLVAIALVLAVPRLRCALMNYLALPLIRLIAPHTFF